MCNDELYFDIYFWNNPPPPKGFRHNRSFFQLKKKMVNRRLQPNEFLTPSPVLAGVLKKKFHIFMYMYLFPLHSIINDIIIDTI